MKNALSFDLEDWYFPELVKNYVQDIQSGFLAVTLPVYSDMIMARFIPTAGPPIYQTALIRRRRCIRPVYGLAEK